MKTFYDFDRDYRLNNIDNDRSFEQVKLNLKNPRSREKINYYNNRHSTMTIYFINNKKFEKPNKKIFQIQCEFRKKRRGFIVPEIKINFI